MLMRMPGTLVTFHAHPDDEALLTSGSMAKAVAEGHRVVLVVATCGEVGEVSPEFLARGESLADRRVRETEASARALGVHRLEFLGYRDSGLAGDAGPGCFVDADLEEAAGRLSAILQEERADVLTIYDPHGGYGHPDHVRVHRVGRRAAELAGTPSVLEATINRDLLRLAADLAPAMGFDLPPDVVPPDLSAWFASPEEITHTIDVSDFLDRKRASMEAHASQTTAATSTVRTLQIFLSLPDELFAAAFSTEWFIDRSRPGLTARDLFSTEPSRRGGS
jgi:LmbE family N-acetylglucosaminyl deacetylase